MPEVREDVQDRAAEEEKVEPGLAKTKADDLYLAAAAESLKTTGDRLQDSLQKLATLAAALAGGGIVALRGDLMLATFRVLTIVALLACLAVAALGTVPTKAPVNLDHIGQCRNFLARAWGRKWAYLKVAVSLLFLAFVIALIGLIVGPPLQVRAPTPPPVP